MIGIKFVSFLYIVIDKCAQLDHFFYYVLYDEGFKTFYEFHKIANKLNKKNVYVCLRARVNDTKIEIISCNLYI
jgi:hypothetical protein